MSHLLINNKNNILRIVAIALLSIFVGIGVNQVHPNGIPFSILMMSFSNISREHAWRPIEADDAFFAYLERNAQFVDIRPADEYQLDHIEAALSLPFPAAFRKFPTNLDTSRQVIIYDFPEHSEKSVAITRQFLRHGYRKTVFLRGGFSSWLQYGFPVQRSDTIE